MHVRRMAMTFTVLASLALVGTSLAADAPGKGARELAGYLGFKSMSSRGASASGYSLDLEYGFYLTPNWEVVPGVGIGSVSRDGRSANDHEGLVSAVYNFPRNGDWLPYARAGLGFGRTEFTGSSIGFMTLPQIAVGARYVKWPTAALNGCLYYDFTELSVKAGNASANTIGLRAGVSWFPKGF